LKRIGENIADYAVKTKGFAQVIFQGIQKNEKIITLF